eukprot:SAG25_NODE_10673_length_326_cov_0.506608_1_plen_42_part_10
MGLWTEQHCAELYDNGYLILRGAVPPELVAPARVFSSRRRHT